MFSLFLTRSSASGGFHFLLHALPTCFGNIVLPREDILNLSIEDALCLFHDLKRSPLYSSRSRLYTCYLSPPPVSLCFLSPVCPVVLPTPDRPFLSFPLCPCPPSSCDLRRFNDEMFFSPPSTRGRIFLMASTLSLGRPRRSSRSK